MPEILNAEVLNSVIKQTAGLLRREYAFPKIGEKMADFLLDQLEAGAYQASSSYPALGGKMTEDIRAIERDLHLAVYYHPDQAAQLEREEQVKKLDEPDLHWWRQRRMDNFGLQKLEILPGNVGYFKLLVLAPVSLVGERITQAMNFLSDSDALIFDLRECGGGDPFTVQLIESYLFNAEPKLLLTLYDRPAEKKQQIWTLPSVPGKRMPDVPVYNLTSSQTFSGGEDFSYTMKYHGRATIVGEISGGGGHTVEFRSVGDGFVLALPTGYPTHPVTGSNWEGEGVQPDIQVPSVQALQTAHLHAIEVLLSRSVDEIKTRLLSATMARQKAIYQPVFLEDAYLQSLVGFYGGYEARSEDGSLILGETGAPDGWKLVPLTETLFMVDEEYNAVFEFDEHGQVTALVWQEIASGREIRSEKINNSEEKDKTK